MKKVIPPVILSIVLLIMGVHLFHRPELPNLVQHKLQQEYAIKPTPKVDHSQFEILQQDFKTPQEVTEACISCHNQSHKEIMASNHWNWDRISYIEGRGIDKIGKQNALNNFCIGATSNEQSCAVCHIGFGMSNNLFDFENAVNVDCMVCHDQSEAYHKGSAMAGYPDRSVNLTEVAQHVGRPGKLNCGVCHFYGGGGNNVKHGDLEEALLSCDRNIDVHMAANGINMTCVDCHKAENHKMKGSLYSVSSSHVNRLTCDECHTLTPHKDKVLNVHTGRIACQTCHIPTYAKENATKMSWNWSTAGDLENGEPFATKDSLGNILYTSQKGTFTWQRNVEPDYYWFNGNATHYVLGDKIDEIPVQMNRLLGSAADINSKIYPVKVHRGDQPYDPNTKLMIQPKLWSAAKGDSAFWMDFNWHESSIAGMQIVNLPYSGEYGFVETEMYWPVNHMVAPKEQSLSCAECHTRDNGRLASLTDFYLPGRDRHAGINVLGKLMLIGASIGVFIHALIRFIIAIKNNKIESQNIQPK